ncbi:type II toxin-antitoxin system VapC family toxin [Massilia phyllosphaerae]|uniref:type II toxin-antitoxin system VapC family toxin n=1 Tax=Massilia phyllosphaerae TaxID=3106034 RepID=UPI002B1CAFF4|nr:VapC toxin family PIN domain ribonuclease [Massilia sp. SGZ-792]
MNGVLVDTSVWVDHFRNRNENLVSLLTLDLALSHPLVVTELACGTPPAPRSRTLSDIATLPQARQATLDEVRGFIEREKLYGLGCGVVDLALLASTLLTPGSRLWSLDRRLIELAQRFDLAFRPALQ